MAVAPSATRSDNGTPAPRSPALAKTLAAKLEQGYAIESESDDRAILVMRGRRRWFGLANGPSVRYEVTVDERGRAKSRRL